MCLRLKVMIWPMEGVWPIGHEFFYELFKCSWIRVCSTIGVITLDKIEWTIMQM